MGLGAWRAGGVIHRDGQSWDGMGLVHDRLDIDPFLSVAFWTLEFWFLWNVMYVVGCADKMVERGCGWW